MSSKEEIILKFGAKKLKSMNWFFGKSDPFLEISRYSISKLFKKEISK